MCIALFCWYTLKRFGQTLGFLLVAEVNILIFDFTNKLYWRYMYINTVRIWIGEGKMTCTYFFYFLPTAFIDSLNPRPPISRVVFSIITVEFCLSRYSFLKFCGPGHSLMFWSIWRQVVSGQSPAPCRLEQNPISWT